MLGVVVEVYQAVEEQGRDWPKQTVDHGPAASFGGAGTLAWICL